MSEFRIDRIKNQKGDNGPHIEGTTTFTGTSGIVLPSGDTYYRSAAGRGILYGGYNPATPTIDSINITTLGNAIKFGNDLYNMMQMTATSSSTRMVFGGGTGTSPTHCRYVQIAEAGHSLEYNDLTAERRGAAGCSDGIRGFYAGGGPGPALDQSFAQDTIDFIVIPTTGKANDFGDLTLQRRQMSSFGSQTRGIYSGGYLYSGPYAAYKNVDFITYSTMGNAQEFGELSGARAAMGGGSNSTRGLIGGGIQTPTPTNTTEIDYMSIASKGNSIDFGALSAALHNQGVCPNSTRAVFAGGYAPSGGSYADTNVMEYVQFSTLGDAVDFGDLSAARSIGNNGASSDSHGGLG